MRGIEARRHDTPPFIAETQMKILEILAKAPDADRLPDFLPEARKYIGQQLDDLVKGRVPLEELLVSQRLSRELNEYSTPSPAARAVWQMQAEGKQVRPGQRVRFLYTRGKPGVLAWYGTDLNPDFRMVDAQRYQVLFWRAVETLMKPIEGHFGITHSPETYPLFSNATREGAVVPLCQLLAA